MKPRRLLPAILAHVLLIVLALPAPAAARPELRAFWADGFNDGYKTPEQVETLLKRLHDTRCNAIFAQMRKGGDAYYASRYEPWATDDQQHFDALAYLIEKAHAMQPRIAVHAWINTCAVGGGKSRPLYHIAQLHPDWLSVDSHNNPDDNEALKIDPGNPDAADWTFRVYLDVARRYDVDGIHFDFVRYGARGWGYNPVSLARFHQQHPDDRGVAKIPGTDLPTPTDPRWQQWRRDQVTALVRKVYAHAVEVNPRIVVSAAVITWGDGPKDDADWPKTSAMTRVYQDWQGWLREGIIDLACPMTYFQSPYATSYERNWSEFIKDRQYHRAATVAVGTWFNTIKQSLEQIDIARKPSARGTLPYGVMLYSYAGTNISERDAKGKRKELEYQPDFYAALSLPSSHAAKPPFTEDAPMPPMSWKQNPRVGHLKGFVLTPNLDAVDGATVMLVRNREYRLHHTDGTGFYAYIDLPPGSYTLQVSGEGYARHEQEVVIEAGKVATVHVTLGKAATPLTPSIAALQGQLPGAAGSPAGLPVRLENLTVTLGSNIYPGNLFVVDSGGFGLRARLKHAPYVPFQAGDVVSVAGTLRLVEGEPTIDEAVVRLTDIQPDSALRSVWETAGRSIRSGQVAPGTLVRVEGDVVDVSDEGFTLDDGVRVLVKTAGLKTYGVEGSPLKLAPPAHGRVAVTGIASVIVAADGGRTVCIRPRGLEDMTVVRPTVSTLLRTPWVRATAFCLFRRPSDLVSAPHA